MNFEVWNILEREIIAIGVKPIIAIVPNNKDEKLKFGPSANNFWERMRHLQDLGWSMGLHGLNHDLRPSNKCIMKTSKFSEFSERALGQQIRMIEKGVKIFSKNSLVPDIWVAPSHGFDQNTLLALKLSGICRVSDGYSALPYTDSNGIFWIPQRGWRFSNYSLKFNTICLHINRWDKRHVDRFLSQIALFKNSIIDLKLAEQNYANRSASPSDKFLTSITNHRVNINRLCRRLAS